MRLIDADKILYFKGKDIIGKDAYMTQKDVIDEMPTVDARPIRHGHWERLYANNYKCSVCGSWWTDDGDTYLIEFNYCPNCGAKMDEGIEDE